MEEIKSEIIDKKEQGHVLNIPPASPMKRTIAGLIDLSIGIGLTFLAYAFMVKRIAITGTKIRWMILKALLPFFPALYLLLKDSLGGKSFGKLILGLTTINIDKKMPSGIADSILRNSLLALVAIPVLGWIAFSVLALLIGIQIIMGREKRLGDEFAKTIVIDDRNLELL